MDFRDKRFSYGLARELKIPVPDGLVALDLGECLEMVEEVGFPCYVSGSDTVGGTGSVIAYNHKMITEKLDTQNNRFLLPFFFA